MNHIPVHKLNSSADIGLEIHRTNDARLKKQGGILGAHRDDHYIFFLIESGEVAFMVDFSEVTITGQSIYYVLPGQVHHGTWSENTRGWFIAVDTALIPKELRPAFENRLLLQQPYQLDDALLGKFQSLLQLTYEHYQSDNNGAFYVSILHSLLNSFLAMVACGYCNEKTVVKNHSRPVEIAYEFKRLLSQNVQQVKSPSAYAELLNISESYLNEALKKVTGFSVTYWILQEVMLEAKRLLYYSQLNVKEIAHHLGYDDHTYFSRLFKKANQVTPLAFKELYRK
ncbi:helix-turn-helix domain-containing protein [Mucilaginibacter sp. Bleaf8]|uniref:AraC family transcriptional regulator n=1 Tax=Mucilaginibacter sp. Bleaf8 TaxID=2834430 RepID=UPI001BCD1F31|nr:AraC family transcriptional regulator [Mucilaginibacter sp. Bleaf8]MBS7563166.1 helix-turn-helix domain-containing protein [Mucilaginibacter sp. Bleaf8]